MISIIIMGAGIICFLMGILILIGGGGWQMLVIGIIIFIIGDKLNEWHKKRKESGKFTFDDAVDGTIDTIGETIVETARDKRRRRRNKESSADKFLREYTESSKAEMKKYNARKELLEKAAQLERDAKFHPSARSRLLYEAQELRRKADKI